MLPEGLVYPEGFPVTWRNKAGGCYSSRVVAVHWDEDPYYTIDVLEGPFAGERQTIKERLSSWVDALPVERIHHVLGLFADP